MQETNSKQLCFMDGLDTCQHLLGAAVHVHTPLQTVLVFCVCNQVLEAQDLLHGLRCALQQLHAAVMELPVQPRER